MEIKKSKSADLNKNRFSFLLMGLICSTSLTLMSFEYSTFNSLNTLEAQEEEELIIIENEIKELKTYVPPQPKPVVKLNRSMVRIAPEPIPVPEPSPMPTPEPVDPYAGFQEPEVGEPGPVEPAIVIDPIFEIVEVMPEFPGGLEAMYSFLGDNVNYPAISLDNNSNGIAYVKFVVEKDGQISDIQVIKGVDQYIDKEASRVVKGMPKWAPGEQMGKKVRVSFVLPINFKID